DILLPTLSAQPPSATTQMTLSANLDASAATDNTFSTPIQVVDSLGVTHILTVAFKKTAANAWSYNVTIPSQDLKGGQAGSDTSIATGSLTFDSSGKLTSPTVTDKPIEAKTTGGLASGGADLDINWSLFGSDGAP